MSKHPASHGSPERERSISVDLSEKDLNDLSIGDSVEVTVRGEVKSLSAGTPGEDDFEGFPPDMRVSISSVKVKKSSDNEFAELSEDTDE